MSTKVRVGYGLGTQALTDRNRFTSLIDDLERLRFDSLWLSERVSGPAPDPIIGLSVAAGRTERLKLGTSVQVLPGRNPVLLAKSWASLDAISNGRALPAFGLGVVNPAEQQAFGVDRTERAGWFDEALPLIRRLWTEESVDHQGERFSYEGVRVLPKPVQDPLEVWLGGRAPSELRRVGRLSDGWLASFASPAQCAQGRPLIEEAADAANRKIDVEHFGAMVFYTHGDIPDALARVIEQRNAGVDPTDIVAAGLSAIRDRCEEYVEHGFSKLVLVPMEEPEAWTDELEHLAADVLPMQT